MLMVPLDRAGALMPDVPNEMVPPLSEAGWLKITPPAVTVPLTVNARLGVLKVAVLPGPAVVSQLLPVTPVQLVDEMSQVPPVAFPDQVAFCAPTGDETTNAKLMKAGNAFRMVLNLLFIGYYNGLMIVFLIVCYMGTCKTAVGLLEFIVRVRFWV